MLSLTQNLTYIVQNNLYPQQGQRQQVLAGERGGERKWIINNFINGVTHLILPVIEEDHIARDYQLA